MNPLDSKLMRFAIVLAFFAPMLALSQNCTIAGQVSNLLSGGPVRKAKVMLGTPGNPKYQSVTDVNGHYAISGIAPGRYTLWVQRTGFLPVVYGAHGPNRPGKSIPLAPGENRKDLNFSVEPPGVITGHIYDQDGEPLSTAVLLYRERWRSGRKRYEVTGGANADDEGQYRLFGLSAGTYVVSTSPVAVRPASPVPSREIYPPTLYPSTEDASAAIPIRLAPGGEARDIDIRVRKSESGNISGTVVAQNLTPDFRLTLVRRDGFPMPTASILYPQPRQFSARGVTPGSYTLVARSATEYRRMDLDIGRLDVDGVELRLSPAIQLTGTLKFDGDEPPPDTMFSMTLSSSESGDPSAQALVDKERRANWKGLSPGRWTLDFAPKLAGLYLKSPPEVEIGPDGHVPIEVVISSRGVTVQGKVQVSSDHPAPVEAATVLLIDDVQKRVLQFTVTAPDGTYSLTRIPPGKYRLLAIEDIETDSWQNPEVLRTFEGKGTVVEFRAGEQASRDLFLSQP
jgi:hypothetical protein